MPSLIINQATSPTCAHGGKAQAIGFSPKVLLDGQPIVTLAGSNAYTITGCTFNISGGASPCLMDVGLTPSAKVLVDGKPTALMQTPPLCTPNGTPLLIVGNQTKVTAT